MLKSAIRCLSDKTKQATPVLEQGSRALCESTLLSIQNCRMAKNDGQLIGQAVTVWVSIGLLSCTAAEWRSIGTRVRSPSRWIADALLAACEQLSGPVSLAFDSPRETCQFSLARLRRRRGGLHRGEKCSASGGFTIGQPPSGILLLHCPFFFFCKHIAFFPFHGSFVV